MPSLLSKHLSGLGDIAAFYDGFILDVWGVLHDGIRAYPDTLETLAEMRRAYRIIWLLSNSPRRAEQVAAQLAQLGISEDMYDGIVTSGETAWKTLKGSYLARQGNKCLHLGSEALHGGVFAGIDIKLVDKASDADFVIVSDDGEGFVERYGPQLESCLKNSLPMLCVNPDKVVHVGKHLIACAGALAEVYEKMGGQVTYLGKPHRIVYSQCLEGMGVRNVLAVGDSMLTDVAGATGAGLDAALVMSGIHRDELSGYTAAPDENRLQEFFQSYPYHPKFVLDKFHW